MTVTLELPDELAAALQERASAEGVSLEDLIRKAAEQQAPPKYIGHLQKTDPEEWARQFDAWVDSHDPNTPVLSDEAMSRESIYPDPH